MKVDASTQEAQAAIGRLSRSLSDLYRIQQNDTTLDWKTRSDAGTKAWQYGSHARALGYAMGGQMKDGWFTVGERGPELGYKSGASTKIFSNSQSSSMLASANVGSSQGANYTINVNVDATADKASVGRVIVEAIASFEKRAGAGWRS